MCSFGKLNYNELAFSQQMNQAIAIILKHHSDQTGNSTADSVSHDTNCIIQNKMKCKKNIMCHILYNADNAPKKNKAHYKKDNDSYDIQQCIMQNKI